MSPYKPGDHGLQNREGFGVEMMGLRRRRGSRVEGLETPTTPHIKEYAEYASNHRRNLLNTLQIIEGI